MKDGEVPQHLQRWAGGDWFGSRVRGFAIRNRDPWLAWIYLDLLFRSFNDGGDLPGDVPHIADLLGFPEEELERVLPLLKERFGKIVEQDGRIFNPRVRKEIERVHRLSEKFAEAGAEGGRKSAEVRRAKSGKGQGSDPEGGVQGRVEGPSGKSKGREAKSLPLPLPSSLPLSSSLPVEKQDLGRSVGGPGGSNGSGPSSPHPDITNDDVDTVIDAYRRLLKLTPSKHPLTAKTANVIRQALTVVNVDEAIEAIEGCVASDFHMGREGKGVHNGIDLVLKDADSIQKFLRIRSREWSSGIVGAFLDRRRAMHHEPWDKEAPEIKDAEQKERFRLLSLDDPWSPWYAVPKY